MLLNFIQHKLHCTEWVHHTTIQNAGLTVTQKWAIYYKLLGGRRGRHPSAFLRQISWGESWWDWEKWPFIFDGNDRGRADSYPNSFLCRSAAQNQSRRQWVLCPGRTVTAANRAPRKEAVKERDTVQLNDVWLPLRIKCFLNASIQFHISLITENSCLHWFWYHYCSSCWCKGTSLPLIWIHLHDKTWMLCGSLFTFGLTSATKSNHSTLEMACLTFQCTVTKDYSSPVLSETINRHSVKHLSWTFSVMGSASYANCLNQSNEQHYNNFVTLIIKYF